MFIRTSLYAICGIILSAGMSGKLSGITGYLYEKIFRKGIDICFAALYQYHIIRAGYFIPLFVMVLISYLEKK